MRIQLILLVGAIGLAAITDATAQRPPRKKIGGDPTREETSAPILSLYQFGRGGFSLGGENALGFNDVYDVVFKHGDCKLGKDFHVEINQGAWKAAGEHLDTVPIRFDAFQQKADLIDQCLSVVKAMERVCEAGGDKAVRAGVKKIRCEHLDRKPLESHVPTQTLEADGTWVVAYSWWTTNDDFLGVEDGLARTLKVSPPTRPASMKSGIKWAQACRKQSDCKVAGQTCWSSNGHGPRCLPPEAFLKTSGEKCSANNQCQSGACNGRCQ
jgi:hypothetical protein